MLSIPTSLRPFVSCVAAVLVLPGLATPRGAAGQSTPARPPLRSAVFPPDTGRVRGTGVGVFRALVDTGTANLSRLGIPIPTPPPGKSPHPPHPPPHEGPVICPHGTLHGFLTGGTPAAR